MFILLLTVYSICKKKFNIKQDKLNSDEVLSILHVAVSFDGRVKRSLNTFIRIDKKATLVNPIDAQEDGDFLRKGLDEKVVLKKSGLSGSFSYFPYTFDIFIFLRAVFANAKYIHCHDINTALIGLLSSKIRGQRVICDLHEWKSQTTLTNKKSNRFARWIYKIVEKIVLLDANHVISVNSHIARLMQKDLGVKRHIDIVKNIPSHVPKKSYNLRNHLSIPKENFIVYYVGQLAPYRNLDFIIKELSHLSNVVLVIQGTITLEFKRQLEDLAKSLNMRDRFFLLPAISHEDIPAYCNGANVGIFTCDHKSSKSMKYSLPNKLFEYIIGGVPIISEDIPVAKQYIDDYDLGLYIDSSCPGSLCQAVKKFLDRSFYDQKYKNVQKARRIILNDDNEDKIYRQIYLKES